MSERSRRRRIAGAVVLGLLVASGVGAWWLTVRMPGSSYEGRLRALSEGERRLAVEMRADVEHLAGEIGERNADHEGALQRAAADIEQRFVAAGYVVRSDPYEVRGHEHRNLEAVLPGTSRRGESIVVGAHYDSA